MDNAKTVDFLLILSSGFLIVCWLCLFSAMSLSGEEPLSITFGLYAIAFLSNILALIFAQIAVSRSKEKAGITARRLALIASPILFVISILA